METTASLGSLVRRTKEDLEFENEFVGNHSRPEQAWRLRTTKSYADSCERSNYRKVLIKKYYEKYLSMRFHELEVGFLLSVHNGFDPTNVWIYAIDLSEEFTLPYKCNADIPLFTGLCISVGDSLNYSGQDRFIENYSAGIWNCGFEIHQISDNSFQTIINYLTSLKNIRCLSLYFTSRLDFKNIDFAWPTCFLPQLLYLKTFKLEGSISRNGGPVMRKMVEKIISCAPNVEKFTINLQYDSSIPVEHLIPGNLGKCLSIKILVMTTYCNIDILSAILTELQNLSLEGLILRAALQAGNLVKAFYQIFNLVSSCSCSSLVSLNVILTPSFQVLVDGETGPHFICTDIFPNLTKFSITISGNTFERDKRTDMDWDFLLLFPNIEELSVNVDFRLFRKANIELPQTLLGLKQANIWILLPKLKVIFMQTKDESFFVERFNV